MAWYWLYHKRHWRHTHKTHLVSWVRLDTATPQSLGWHLQLANIGLENLLRSWKSCLIITKIPWKRWAGWLSQMLNLKQNLKILEDFIFIFEGLGSTHYRLWRHSLLATNGSWLWLILVIPRNLVWLSHHQNSLKLKTSKLDILYTGLSFHN